MRWHTGSGGGEWGVCGGAHTYQGRVYLRRPQAAQKFLPSAWSTSIPRWRPVGGALTAYISAHSTSHPALRGTPFTSTIHPLRHPSWRARPHRRVRSSWGRQRWGLGGIVGSRDVRADIGIALERRATFAPGNTELPSFTSTRSVHFSTPVARDSFFLRLAPEISEESHDHACRPTDVPRARNTVYLYAEYRIFLRFFL